MDRCTPASPRIWPRASASATSASEGSGRRSGRSRGEKTARCRVRPGEVRRSVRRPTSGNRHVPRITAELRDVVSHPLKRRPLIQQAVVAGGGMGRVLVRERRVRQEPERTMTVIRGDDDYALLLDQPPPVVGREVGGGCREAPGVEPHDDRRRLCRRGIADPDVQFQAVLKARRRPRDDRGTNRRRRRGREHRRPRRGGLRRFPAEVADRGRRERHAQERTGRTVVGSLHVAINRRHEARSALLARFPRG